MYIAPRQGQTTHWGKTFDVNRKPLSLCSFVAGSGGSVVSGGSGGWGGMVGSESGGGR